MHVSEERAPRQEALARRERLVRRRTHRRIRQAIVASAAAFTGALLLTADRAPAPTRSAGSAPTAPQLTWRRPGELLTRDKATPSSFAFAADPRVKERHESLNRWHHIYNYSAKYRIKPDLARRIYDAAIKAGIEPELGFRLVRVESVFDPKAESPVGALGLTQLMPSTARVFEPNVTREQLLTADVNLRIGFRYLRGLIREYKGDLKLALLVYNRGPVAVSRALAMGRSPANGYETVVTKGYRGRGTLD
jgi:soluble lytic murein transglycosylase-like protein